jgi:hypothetical protein
MPRANCQRGGWAIRLAVETSVRRAAQAERHISEEISLYVNVNVTELGECTQ